MMGEKMREAAGNISISVWCTLCNVYTGQNLLRNSRLSTIWFFSLLCSKIVSQSQKCPEMYLIYLICCEKATTRLEAAV